MRDYDKILKEITNAAVDESKTIHDLYYCINPLLPGYIINRLTLEQRYTERANNGNYFEEESDALIKNRNTEYFVECELEKYKPLNSKIVMYNFICKRIDVCIKMGDNHTANDVSISNLDVYKTVTCLDFIHDYMDNTEIHKMIRELNKAECKKPISYKELLERLKSLESYNQTHFDIMQGVYPMCISVFDNDKYIETTFRFWKTSAADAENYVIDYDKLRSEHRKSEIPEFMESAFKTNNKISYKCFREYNRIVKKVR